MLLEGGFLAYLFGFSIFEADCIEDEMCALIEEGTKRLDAGGFAFATEFCSCWNDKCRIGCFCELSVWIRGDGLYVDALCFGFFSCPDDMMCAPGT